MPFYLKESLPHEQLDGLRSVLLVPCRFCPAASLAVRAKEPYIEPFRRLLKTGAYESYIETLERRLEARGIEVAVFKSRLLHQFVACMWTSRRRSALARRAARFDGVIVLGCDAMVQAVRDALKPTSCRVVPGMEIEGLMNVLPSVAFPCDVTLRLQGVAPVATPSPVGEGGRPR